MSALEILPSKYFGVMPAFARTSVPAKGHKLVDLKRLGILPGIGGGAGGFNQASDLVTQTIDGFDLNDLWNEYQQAVALANQERQRLIQFLTFPVVRPQERVPQISGAKFERASEFGEPRGIRPTVAQWTLGYDFHWYDLAARFTWKFLAEAPRAQVDAINAMALEADNRMVFDKVMEALFTNTNRVADINGQLDVPVYSLYNNDGTVPPPYKGNTFDGTHNHYLVSGAATVDAGDLEAMYDHLDHHGYNAENGMTIVVLVNKQEGKLIRQIRLGGTGVSTGATWDFVPATGQPGMFVPDDVRLLGSGQPANSFRGLNVIGSYGNMLIVQEDGIPAGYMVAIATGGTENLGNPVGIREHENASLRGLRLVKGATPDYPILDSFYQRGFGTGIRQRGGSVVMQIKTSAPYVVPAAYSFDLTV